MVVGTRGHVTSAGGKQSVMKADAQHPLPFFSIYDITPWDGAECEEPNPDHPLQLTQSRYSLRGMSISQVITDFVELMISQY